MKQTRLFIHIGLFLTILLLPDCSRRDAGRDAANLSAQAEAALSAHDFGKALQLAGQAISLIEQTDADSALGEYYLLRGTCLQELGRYEDARENLLRAAERFHTVGQHKLERKGRIALAAFNERIGQYNAAMTYALDAAAAARVFNDIPDLFKANRIAADVCRSTGNYDRALQMLEELLAIDSSQFHSRYRLDLLASKLRVCRDAGRYDQASDAAANYAGYAIASADSSALVAATVAWGRAQQAMGHADSAFRTYSHALDLLTVRIDPGVRADAISALAALMFGQQNVDNAKRLFNDALRSNAQTDNVALRQMLQAMILACDARTTVRAAGGAPADYVKSCTELLDSAQVAGLRTSQLAALFLLAQSGSRAGKADTALAYARRAVDIYEKIPGLPDDDGMAPELFNTLVDGQDQAWYDPIFQRAAAQNRPADLFEFIERKNIHDLGRFFSRLPMEIRDSAASRAIRLYQWKVGALAAVERDLLDEVSRGRQGGNERLDSLRNALRRPPAEIERVESELERTSRNFSWLLGSRVPTLKQVTDSLHPECALLEYAPLPNGVAILAATRDSAIVRTAPINRAHLDDLIQEYMRLIGDPRLNVADPKFNAARALGRIQDLSAILSTVLVEPVVRFLGKTTTLYVVLPPEFGWLPLHTFRMNGTPIVVRFNINYLPTAAALLFEEKPQHVVYDIVGMGHPGRTSWDVEYELKDIRGFFDKARMLFYSSATLRNLDSAKYDLLHVAAEFVLNTALPWKSVITLSDGHSQEGRRDVPLGDALRIGSPEALIFSNISPTQGGFFRYAPAAFLAAGTPEVIATMWQGERKAKKYFGEIFYTGLQSGMTPEQAYQSAAVICSKNPDFSKPHRWGLFTLFGK